MKNINKFILVFFTVLLGYHTSSQAIGDGGFDGGITPWFYQCTHENLDTNVTKIYAMVMSSEVQCPAFDPTQSSGDVTEYNKSNIIPKAPPVPIAHVKTTGSAHDCKFGLLPDWGL